MRSFLLIVALCLAPIPLVMGCGGRCREAVAPVGSGKIECHHNAKLKRVGDNWVCTCD